MIQEFNGIKAVPPGEYLKEQLGYLSLENKENYVADFLELSLQEYKDLLEGGIEIDDFLAGALAELVGIEKGFWLATEKEYRKALEQIQNML